jgi:hypothetical protein
MIHPQQVQPIISNKVNSKPTKQLMTTAAFAQTKFGSTKLKSNNNNNSTRRHGNMAGNNRNMSPTEFSNYIKQKQLLQEQAQAAQAAAQAAAWSTANSTGGSGIGGLESNVNSAGSPWSSGVGLDWDFYNASSNNYYGLWDTNNYGQPQGVVAN